MKIRLKDIIDLDYLITMDEALCSGEDIQARAIKDRKIYHQCMNRAQTDISILFCWLKFRKAEFFRDGDQKKFSRMPGTIFSSLYTWMVYAAIFSGSISGISLVISFLAYHGTRPINVAVFIALFIVLQVGLLLFALVLAVWRILVKKNTDSRFSPSILHTLVAALFFNVLPKILKKAGGAVFKKNLDTLDYTSSLIRMKNREYKGLFFWPVFILISVFSFSFSAGALGGTFFRVIVSDMAFGWQSTLMATSTRVHDLISLAALPWSWFIPEGLAHPGLEQIEGSRIILKDGISVLATQDLVSWWPFICLGILFYAVIPRGFLIVMGIFAQRRAVKKFNFNRPRFRQLILRMQSPLLDIDAGQIPDVPFRVTPGVNKHSTSGPGPAIPDQSAVILASKKIYSEKAIQKIIRGIEQHLFFDVKGMAGINFNLDDDRGAISRMDGIDVDQVILLHEVWQPPIRGVLHYIKQIRTAMPEGLPLYILLTRDAGQEDLGVDSDDIDYDVWKKAIIKLEDPGIVVERFVSP